MAASLPFTQVALTADDVPGAALPLPTVQSNSVLSLKRFLSCRGLPISGKKADLVERVTNALDKNVSLDPNIDRGHWLTVKTKSKRQRIVDKLIKPPVFPLIWSKFPTMQWIPKGYCYGHIYAYLSSVKMHKVNPVLDDDSDSDKENVCDGVTAKPFQKGRKYYTSGNVTNVEDDLCKGYYCLKSLVKASFLQNSYCVMVMLNTDGEIVDASWHCKASALARCSHVAALLYHLEGYLLKTSTSCTTTLCQWNQGSKWKNPGPITKQYNNSIDPLEKVNFSPHIPHATDDLQRTAEFRVNMQTQNSCWGLILQPPYEDFDLEPDEERVLKAEVDMLVSNVYCSTTAPKCIVAEQNNAKWQQYRKILVTASSIKECHVNKTKEQLFNIVSRHMYSRVIVCKDFEYGHKKEPVALEEYRKKMGTIEVQTTGLWVNPKYPGIGASPDGLVTDSTQQGGGLVEIKCPILFEHAADLVGGFNTLTPEQKGRFCCTLQNKQFELKKQHKYYYQVQTQMAVTSCQWCDFVLWCPKDIHVQRIWLEEAFFIDLYNTASKFHKQVLCPEYFLQKVPRKLPPTIVN